jgi:hypothetical protein
MENTPAGRPGISETVWAILGLAAALVLAGISIDLLIGSRGAPADAPPAGGEDDGCGC